MKYIPRFGYLKNGPYHERWLLAFDYNYAVYKNEFSIWFIFIVRGNEHSFNIWWYK